MSYVSFAGRSLDFFLGLERLLRSIDTAAFHDSMNQKETYGTLPTQYEDILQLAMDWSRDSQVTECTLWVHGPLFTHTIAQCVANLQEQDHVCLATYFVGQPPDNEDVRTRFISTIAYQLCLSFPNLREEIGRVVAHDPIVLMRSISRQLDSLILQPLAPFLSISDGLGDGGIRPVVIVVDGYDYLDHLTQTRITGALFKFARQYPRSVRILLFTKSSAGISTAITSGVQDGSIKEIGFGEEQHQVDRQAKHVLPFRLRSIMKQVWKILVKKGRWHLTTILA